MNRKFYRMSIAMALAVVMVLTNGCTPNITIPSQTSPVPVSIRTPTEPKQTPSTVVLPTKPRVPCDPAARISCYRAVPIAIASIQQRWPEQAPKQIDLVWRGPDRATEKDMLWNEDWSLSCVADEMTVSLANTRTGTNWLVSFDWRVTYDNRNECVFEFAIRRAELTMQPALKPTCTFVSPHLNDYMTIVYNYVSVHYPNQIPSTLAWQYQGTTTASSEAKYYWTSDEWYLTMTQDKPPYQVALVNYINQFRWEGEVRAHANDSRCVELFDGILETSVTIPRSTPKQMNDLITFLLKQAYPTSRFATVILTSDSGSRKIWRLASNSEIEEIPASNWKEAEQLALSNASNNREQIRINIEPIESDRLRSTLQRQQIVNSQSCTQIIRLGITARAGQWQVFSREEGKPVCVYLDPGKPTEAPKPK